MEPDQPQEFMCGGIGESQPANPEVQAICDSVKSEVEQQRGVTYEIFEAVSYRTQTVAGCNYFVKVHVGENKHLELTVFVGLPHTNSGPVLQSVLEHYEPQLTVCYGSEPLKMMPPLEPVELLCGGIGDSQPANPEVQAICDSVKSEVEQRRGVTYDIFEAVSYRTQTVAGCNYFVKVHVGENKHLQLKVFVGLPHTNSGPELQSVHESTDDQISNLELEGEGVRLIDPQPFICSYGFRPPEIMAPEYPVELVCGGFGDSQPADPEVQAMCDSVKSEVEQRRRQKYEIFEAVSYNKQTVYGYNYSVKVHVGENKHLELILYIDTSSNSVPVLCRVKEFTDDQMSDMQQEIRHMEPFRPQEFMCGGIGDSQPANPEVQAICDSVKSEVEQRRGVTYEIFEAISYRTQTVAGCNYFVKVHVGENKHLQLKVFVGLPHTNSGPKLQSVDESTDDQISNLEQTIGGVILTDPQPISCTFELQTTEMTVPDNTRMIEDYGESQPADPEVQAMCDSVKSEVEDWNGEKYEIFEAVSYSKRADYGYSYAVTVHVGENKHVQLSLHVESPNSKPVLRGTATPMEPLRPQEFMCGGIGDSQPANPEVQAICDSVKSEVEQRRGVTYEIFEAVSYRTQTVAGCNYFVKVHVGENKHLQLKVFVGLPHTNSGPELQSVHESTDDQISNLELEGEGVRLIDPQPVICTYGFRRPEIMAPEYPVELVCGGIGDSQPANPEVQAICDSVKSEVEQQRGVTYEIFEAVSYRTQTVAGCNYFIKVHVGENKHLELTVFVGLPHTNSGPVLQSVLEHYEPQLSVCYGSEPLKMKPPLEPVELLCGGIGDSQPANPEVQAICDSVKSEVEQRRGVTYDIFEAVSYRTQTVAGCNYFVKVHVGENKHLQLKVFVGLPHTNSGPELQSVHESTDDQISNLELEGEGVRLIDPQPFICSYGFRPPEIMAPEYPVELVCGGFGDSQPADPEVQAMCDSVKSEVEQRRRQKYEIFEAVSYNKQTVYGYNYSVKVHVGENKHLELILYMEPSSNSVPVLCRVKEFTDDQMSDMQQEFRHMEPFRPQFMCGGIEDSQPANPEVQAICDSVKSEVEQQRGVTYEIFEAVSYRTQTVAGCNYFIKVHVGENKHLELTVFVGLPHTNSAPVLQSVLEHYEPQVVVCYGSEPLEMMPPLEPVELLCGGIGDSQPANPEVQAICDSVKSEVEQQRGVTYEIFEAISYRTQTVAGCNYFIKVHVGENKHLELTVFVGLPHTNSGPVLQSVLEHYEPQLTVCYGSEPLKMMPPEEPVELLCGGIADSGVVPK